MCTLHAFYWADLLLGKFYGCVSCFRCNIKFVLSNWPEVINLKVNNFVNRSCLTLCDPVDCSPPGSSVHGILQAGILEWVAISFSRGSSRPRNRNCVSCTTGRFFSAEPKTNISSPKSTSFLRRYVPEVRFLYFHFYDNRDNCILDNFPCLLTSFWSLFHFYISLIAHSVSSEEKKSSSLSPTLFFCGIVMRNNTGVGLWNIMGTKEREKLKILKQTSLMVH